jgi:hypothetical protein
MTTRRSKGTRLSRRLTARARKKRQLPRELLELLLCANCRCPRDPLHGEIGGPDDYAYGM